MSVLKFQASRPLCRKSRKICCSLWRLVWLGGPEGKQGHGFLWALPEKSLTRRGRGTQFAALKLSGDGFQLALYSLCMTQRRFFLILQSASENLK